MKNTYAQHKVYCGEQQHVVKHAVHGRDMMVMLYTVLAAMLCSNSDDDLILQCSIEL